MKYIEKIQEKIYLSRLNSGDTEVFVEIYHNFSDRIYRYIYYRIMHKQDSEDLTSEVFMKTWQYARNGEKNIKHLNAFLFQIARNTIADYYRRSSRTRDVQALDSFQNIPDEKQKSLFAEIENGAGESEIEKALLRLEDDQKERIIIHYIEGLPCPEISKIVNKSNGAVRIAIHRAMKELKKNLNLKEENNEK